jgi:hypothetical protein
MQGQSTSALIARANFGVERAPLAKRASSG